ncbi:MAG: hypothetical protein QOE29_220, partial [Gaiellaceae bacterium]|nr:hypothetical protein [Gaiellaceae bacterium]
MRRARLVLAATVVLALVLFAHAAQADPPALEGVPGSQTAEATGPGGASVSWADPTASDGSPVFCDPSSGSTFEVRTSTVTCTATNPDTSETASASFSVTVQDTTDPTVSVPGTTTASATSASGATVTFSASASDLVDGSISPDCSPSSGSTFALGTTGVTCSATDSHGNTGSASFNVVVTDDGNPTVSVPANITTPATGAGGAAVTYSVSASDAIDPSPAVGCDKASGSTFVVGTTTVTCTATDNGGNTGSASFTVTVTDGVSPIVTVPGNITTEATGSGGAAVSFSASANDDVDGARTPSCSPGSGATFPIGATTVTCTAQDSSGNTGSNSFTVTVRDTTAPVLTVPGTVVGQATTLDGATVTFTVGATDSVDGSLAATCNKASGTLFPFGSTTVTCSASDTHSNSASASFTVRVVDTTPPFIPTPPDLTAEADGPAGATLTYAVPTAFDLGEPVS